MGTRVHLSRLIGFRDTRANVEANSATLEELTLAYATDTGEIGVYTNGAWVWKAGPAEPVGQYLQFLYSVGGGTFAFLTDAAGNPLMGLENLQ